ncbi:MAG: ATP synthase subunit I [Nitrospiria bacterium]
MDHPAPNPPEIDCERFLAKSNAALHRIERNSLLILAGGGLATLFIFGNFGVSLLIGGLLGMFNFRSLHRMFQRQVLDPFSKRKAQFFYSLKLFFLVGLFFWIIQWESASVLGIIGGFFMTAGAVLLESQRK